MIFTTPVEYKPCHRQLIAQVPLLGKYQTTAVLVQFHLPVHSFSQQLLQQVRRGR